MSNKELNNLNSMEYDRYRYCLKKEEIPENCTLFARIADNVLDEKNWPVAKICIHNGKCIEQTEIKKGVYQMSDLLHKDVNELAKWSCTHNEGQHPVNFYELKLIGPYQKELDKKIIDALQGEQCECIIPRGYIEEKICRECGKSKRPFNGLVGTISSWKPKPTKEIAEAMKEALKRIKKDEEIYIKNIEEMIKEKFNGVLPEDWMIIFPKEYEHPIPAIWKDRIKFSEYVKDNAYIINNDCILEKFKDLEFPRIHTR